MALRTTLPTAPQANLIAGEMSGVLGVNCWVGAVSGWVWSAPRTLFRPPTAGQLARPRGATLVGAPRGEQEARRIQSRSGIRACCGGRRPRRLRPGRVVRAVGRIPRPPRSAPRFPPPPFAFAPTCHSPLPPSSHTLSHPQPPPAMPSRAQPRSATLSHALRPFAPSQGTHPSPLLRHAQVRRHLPFNPPILHTLPSSPIIHTLPSPPIIHTLPSPPPAGATISSSSSRGSSDGQQPNRRDSPASPRSAEWTLGTFQTSSHTTHYETQPTPPKSHNPNQPTQPRNSLIRLPDLAAIADSLPKDSRRRLDAALAAADAHRAVDEQINLT